MTLRNIAVVLVIPSLASCSQWSDPVAEARGRCMAQLTHELSRDALQGRDLGTPGLDHAADAVHQALFEQVRGIGTVQRQTFSLIQRDIDNTEMSDGEPLRPGIDGVPLWMSEAGPFSGEVVFAGFGITAPDLNYDDYATADVDGKIALILRHHPSTDAFNDAADLARLTDMRRKAIRARDNGAVGVVFVSPQRTEKTPTDIPTYFGDEVQLTVGIPVVHVTTVVADRWLQPNATVLSLTQGIDSTGTFPPLQLDRSVSGTVASSVGRLLADNVVATVPGVGSLADEVIVLGAHYDHVGFGDEVLGLGNGTLPDSIIHNGADDNASGTAGIICSIPNLGFDQTGDRRTLVVAAFAAEEHGLYGSALYVDRALPDQNIVAMVNLDMIGRLRDNTLTIEGTYSSDDWLSVVEPATDAAEMLLETPPAAASESDQLSFIEEGIPGIHLFTGLHSDYHEPGDEFPALDLWGSTRVAQVTEHIVADLLTRPTAPASADVEVTIVGDFLKE